MTLSSPTPVSPVKVIPNDSAAALIEQLGLEAHPEGGWFRETWRAPVDASGRSAGTAILFMLKTDESSHWHRVDADEMWLWQGGDPLDLLIAKEDSGPVEKLRLGPLTTCGTAALQGLAPKGAWQAARPVVIPQGGAGYTLVSCVVVPGFEFSGFELASPGWEPNEVHSA